MHFQQLIVTVLPLLASNAAGAAVQPGDRNLYPIEVAPKVLDRVSDFRTKHDTSLTSRQRDFLDETVATIKAVDVNRASHLQETCPGVFNAEECLYILTGQQTSSGKEARADKPECGCSTESDWCPDRIGPIWYCKMGGCKSPGVWCGTLGMWYCNGTCKPKL